MANKRTLNRNFSLISPNGNIRYTFCREMKYRNNGERVPFVIVQIKKGAEISRGFIHYDDMNAVMRDSIMRNFKRWCHCYILNSGEFDPATDRVMEL